MRNLNAKDVKRMAQLLGSEFELLKEVTSETPGETKEEQQGRVGMAIANALLNRHLDTMWDWLADIAQMTTEELDEAPPGKLLEIIQHLKESGDLLSFFGQVRQFAAQLKKPEELGTE